MRTAIALTTTAQLEQRRDELLYVLGVAEHQLALVMAALCAREPGGVALPPGVRHGTITGYRHKCHCSCCCEANAAYQAAARDRKRTAERERQRAKRAALPITPGGTKPMPEHPKIARPTVELAPGPRGLFYGLCRHCPWEVGPSVKTYVQERMVAHRRDHRLGTVPVTKAHGAHGRGALVLEVGS